MTCLICKGTQWVCEYHPDISWENGDECCGGAGAPCPKCNPYDRDHPPAITLGTTLIWDRDKGYLN